jgi:hypothetical protein
MARNRLKNPQQLMTAQQLRQFADFSEQHTRWQQLIGVALSELQLAPLRSHVQVLNVRANTLIIQVSSAAVAQRLKSVQGRIITHFADGARTEINAIDWRIQPKPINSPEKIEKPEVKQNDTVNTLRQQALLCDEPLRSQLLALADKYQRSEGL